MGTIQEALAPIGAATVGLLVLILALAVLRRLLERRRIREGAPRFASDLVLVCFAIVGMTMIILLLPVSETTQGQLLSFLGIVISASVALSSGSLVGNAMGGVTMRIGVSRMDVGDLIIVGEHTGRVTEIGVLHTEIQAPGRDVVWLPNQWLANQPVKVLQESGTLVSETVSLRYEEPRQVVEDLLRSAAADAGLKEPHFAGVAELKESSAIYQVGGMVADTKLLYSMRRRFRGAIMDRLQEAGIDIVSPRYVTLDTDSPERLAALDVPPRAGSDITDPGDGSAPEAVGFDLADRAVERARETRAIRDELADLRRSMRSVRDPAEQRRLKKRERELEKRLQDLQHGH